MQGSTPVALLEADTALCGIRAAAVTCRHVPSRLLELLHVFLSARAPLLRQTRMMASQSSDSSQHAGTDTVMLSSPGCIPLLFGQQSAQPSQGALSSGSLCLAAHLLPAFMGTLSHTECSIAQHIYLIKKLIKNLLYLLIFLMSVSHWTG